MDDTDGATVGVYRLLTCPQCDHNTEQAVPEGQTTGDVKDPDCRWCGRVLHEYGLRFPTPAPSRAVAPA